MAGTAAVEIEFLEEAVDMLKHARQKVTLVKSYCGENWCVTLAQAQNPEQVVCVLSRPAPHQIVQKNRKISSVAVLTRPILEFDDLVYVYDRLYNEPVPVFFPFPCRTLTVRKENPPDLYAFKFGTTVDRYSRQAFFLAQHEDKGEIVRFKIAMFAPTYTTLMLVSPDLITDIFGAAATDNGHLWFEPINPVRAAVAENCVLTKDMFGIKCDDFRVWHGSLVLADPSTIKTPEIFRKVHELASLVL